MSNINGAKNEANSVLSWNDNGRPLPGGASLWCWWLLHDQVLRMVRIYLLASPLHRLTTSTSLVQVSAERLRNTSLISCAKACERIHAISVININLSILLVSLVSDPTCFSPTMAQTVQPRTSWLRSVACALDDYPVLGSPFRSNGLMRANTVQFSS